jgi:hypothetical protein
MQAHSVQVVCPPIYYSWVAPVSSVLLQGSSPRAPLLPPRHGPAKQTQLTWASGPGQFDTEARSREDVPEWQALVRRCAEQRELLSWQPVDPPHLSKMNKTTTTTMTTTTTTMKKATVTMSKAASSSWASNGRLRREHQQSVAFLAFQSTFSFIFRQFFFNNRRKWPARVREGRGSGRGSR